MNEVKGYHCLCGFGTDSQELMIQHECKHGAETSEFEEWRNKWYEDGPAECGYYDD